MLIGGKYVLGKQIGTGAFGEIFEGVCKADGTKVAIKLVSPEPESHLDRRKRQLPVHGSPARPKLTGRFRVTSKVFPRLACP